MIILSYIHRTFGPRIIINIPTNQQDLSPNPCFLVSRVTLAEFDIDPGPHFLVKAAAAGRKLLKFFSHSSFWPLSKLFLESLYVWHDDLFVKCLEPIFSTVKVKGESNFIILIVSRADGALIYLEYKVFDLCYNLMDGDSG